MDEKKYLEALKEAILTFDYDKVERASKEAMDANIDPLRAIAEGMSPAMSIVGKKFETGEFFLSELVVAANVMKEGMKIISPYIKKEDSKIGKKVVIATVEGDNHDIGKNMVTTLLETRGFQVVDLGIDVPAEKIVDAVKKHKPIIVGLSALLTVTMEKMEEVIAALKASGLREKVKVIIGGAPVTAEFAERISADYGTNNAAAGVEKCIDWMNSQEGK